MASGYDERPVEVSFDHWKLPDEVWVMIFRSLPAPLTPPERQRGGESFTDTTEPILCLAFTCKRMQCIALPLLFMNADLTTPYGLARTTSLMTRHPTFIAQVRRVWLDGIVFSPAENFFPFLSTPSPSDLNRAIEKLRSFILFSSNICARNSKLAVIYHGSISRFRTLMVPPVSQHFAAIFHNAEEISLEGHFLTTLDEVQDIFPQCRVVQSLRMLDLNMPTGSASLKPLPRTLRVLLLVSSNISPIPVATWLTGLPLLETLIITDVDWSCKQIDSLIATFKTCGPQLRTLKLGNKYRNKVVPGARYLRLAKAVAEMVQCCTALTSLHLFGVCYRPGIVYCLPQTLVTLVLRRMKFHGAPVDPVSLADFLAALSPLRQLRTLELEHDYDSTADQRVSVDQGLICMQISVWDGEELETDLERYDRHWGRKITRTDSHRGISEFNTTLFF